MAGINLTATAAKLLWNNRDKVAKAAVALIALLMIPVVLICMLPTLIFGGVTASTFNDSDVVTDNLTQISTSVSTVLSEGLTATIKDIAQDFANSTADEMEIINPFETSPVYNANLFISQYCAAKSQDVFSISLTDMEDMLRQGKRHFYSYTKETESRLETSTSTEIDEATGAVTVKTETVTVVYAIYTIYYHGESYFADTVFHLTDDQKDLADDYAYNLSLFLGDSMFQRLPDSYEALPSLGNIRFHDGAVEVVYFNQLDECYAHEPYGIDTIGPYGCGPTAMAMVVSSLTSDYVDPAEMAVWAYENNYWCSGSGSYHSLISGAAQEWRLPVAGCSSSEAQRIVDALGQGKLVVALMGKGHFTNSGHFIVLRGIQDGKILVADPASYTRSQQVWELSTILSESARRASAGGPFWIIG